MTRRRFGLLLGVIIVLAGLSAMAAVGVVRLRRDPPLGWYLHWSWSSCALPEKHIRGAFRYVTGRDMPAVARNVQAIWFGGREPRMFVRFETDANGLAYMEQTFTIRAVECEPIDTAYLEMAIASGITFFPAVSIWQERSGLIVFDPNALGSGRKITHSTADGGGWEILIDDEHETVYAYAWPYT